MQSGRPSGALKAISGHQWPSVAISGHQWQSVSSVAISGTRLLLTRHARLLLRLRRRLRLPHPQRLGRPSRLLGRLRTLQPLSLLTLPCLRARGAIKGNQGQSRAISGDQGQLDAINGNIKWRSRAIRRNRWQSMAINGNQSQSRAACLFGLALGFPRLDLRLIRGNQWQSVAIKGSLPLRPRARLSLFGPPHGASAGEPVGKRGRRVGGAPW